jgi:hypothetical protein
MLLGNAFVSGMKEDVRLPHKLNDSVANFTTAQLVREPEKLFDYLFQHRNHSRNRPMSNDPA